MARDMKLVRTVCIEILNVLLKCRNLCRPEFEFLLIEEWHHVRRRHNYIQ